MLWSVSAFCKAQIWIDPICFSLLRWMEEESQWILCCYNRKIRRWPADQRERTYRTKAYIWVSARAITSL